MAHDYLSHLISFHLLTLRLAPRKFLKKNNRGKFERFKISLIQLDVPDPLPTVGSMVVPD